ncbi:MAG: hypothetical protein RR356_05260 [Bacteroidales bacterium]
MRKFLFTASVLMLSMALFGQQNELVKPKKIKSEKIKDTTAYKINAVPVISIFTNFHVGFGKESKKTGFGLDRSYLGVRVNFMKNLYARVVFDIGLPGVEGASLDRVAYVKHAFLGWTPGKFTLNAGLIKLEQFDVQEKFWGYRYIYKSFQDAYDFGSSADLGVMVSYKFTKWISADISFTNGEGYKKLNMNNRFKYSAAVTLNPVESLTARIYYDRADKEIGDTLGKAQENIALFLGYKHRWFSIAAEYNNLFNQNYQRDKNKWGASGYFSVKLPKNFTIFGRYDYLTSNGNWAYEEDGQFAIVGFEYAPIKYVKISPNFRAWIPKQQKAKLYFYLNLLVAM